MSPSPSVDQQLVIHLFAPTDGPMAQRAYRRLRDVWLGCRHLFAMADPIPGVDLPHHLPDTAADLPPPDAPEMAVAAQERRGADFQAILRRHQDVLNLSVALAPRAGVDGDPPYGRSWWTELTARWDVLVADAPAELLGEARLYLAGLAADDPQVTGVGVPCSPRLASRLAPLLPISAHEATWRDLGVTWRERFAVWEPAGTDDSRACRSLVIAGPAEADADLSALLWSRGDTAIPPLARHLLHAAKIRYQLRVWQRDAQVLKLRDELAELAARLRQDLFDPAACGDTGRASTPQSTDRTLLRLRRRQLDASLLAFDLREMRHSVEITLDNLRAAGVMAPDAEAGPLADDAALAGWLLARLDDDAAFLDTAGARAERVLSVADLPVVTSQPARPTTRRASGSAGPAPAQRSRSGRRGGAVDDDAGAATAGQEPPGDAPRRDGIARHVFVVSGRDTQVRDQVVALLRALDLRPLAWEAMVRGTGSATPYTGEVLAHAVTRAQAAVVLLTPDDVVRQHPDLHAAAPDPPETGPALQPGPNVLVQLGMVLAAYPERTVIIRAGVQRPIAELAGRTVIQLEDTPGCRHRIALRLRLAGCPVDDEGEDWLAAGRFTGLGAHDRRP